MCLVCDKTNSGAIFKVCHYYSNAASALVACDGQQPFISLRVEETHAVHDHFGLVTAGAFDYPKIISQNG